MSEPTSERAWKPDVCRNRLPLSPFLLWPKKQVEWKTNAPLRVFSVHMLVSFPSRVFCSRRRVSDSCWRGRGGWRHVHQKMSSPSWLCVYSKCLVENIGIYEISWLKFSWRCPHTHNISWQICLDPRGSLTQPSIPSNKEYLVVWFKLLVKKACPAKIFSLFWQIQCSIRILHYLQPYQFML